LLVTKKRPIWWSHKKGSFDAAQPMGVTNLIPHSRSEYKGNNLYKLHHKIIKFVTERIEISVQSLSIPMTNRIPLIHKFPLSNTRKNQTSRSSLSPNSSNTIKCQWLNLKKLGPRGSVWALSLEGGTTGTDTWPAHGNPQHLGYQQKFCYELNYLNTSRVKWSKHNKIWYLKFNIKK